MSVTSVERAATPFRALQADDGSQRSGAWAYFVYALIFFGFIITVYWQLSGVLPHILALLNENSYGWLIAYPSLFWTAAGLLLLGARTLFWAIYRPIPAIAREEAPSITVIIPAYNEGAMVMNAITSIVEADYPRDKIEIIAIDDGSKDDTWDYISAAAERYPGLVTALRQDRNRGKREAMALAIGRARGDIFVTVDSDSVIERGALLAVVAPFRNPRIGAVAGKVLVYNRRSGIIPRMLHVRFILSFDLLRASELCLRQRLLLSRSAHCAACRCRPPRVAALARSAVSRRALHLRRRSGNDQPAVHGRLRRRLPAERGRSHRSPRRLP